MISYDDKVSWIKAYADETDALIVQIGVPVDREFLGKFKKCKVVSVYGIGYNLSLIHI